MMRTTRDDIGQTISHEYTMDQSWYYTSAVDDDDYTNMVSGAWYSYLEAADALERYTVQVRDARGTK